MNTFKISLKEKVLLLKPHWITVLDNLTIKTELNNQSLNC